MRTERRCVQRKRPGGISYFEFEAGSGGIVLDASDKGLGFQAADEVHQLGPSRIWISPRPEERIEFTGDVVWTDKSRKTGGLRFLEAGGDNSQKVHNWLGRPEESEESAPSAGLPLPAWAPTLGDPRANLPRPAVVPRAKAEVAGRQVALHAIPGWPSLFTSSMPWQPQDSPASDQSIAYRIAAGILVVVLALVGVVLLDTFRPKVGESLIHLGEKINGSTSLRPQNSSPQPASAQATERTGPTSEAKPDTLETEANPAIARKETQEDAALSVESSKQVHTETSGMAIPRSASETKKAPNRSPNREAASSRQDRSNEATRLWSAIASGDASAEVELARLYLRGDGVPRNCLQAKVLLRAAAKSGSAQARQQLKKLQVRGCG